MKYGYKCIPVIMPLALAILSACSTETPESATGEVSIVETEKQETVGLMEETDVGRRKTVFFDLDGGPVTDPGLWNPFMPGRRLVHGFIQALMEPLFILNYETGEIEPWLAQSMTTNGAFDVWTLTLRDGIKWSDGENFNADDVVFTINMLLEKGARLHLRLLGQLEELG